MSRLKRSADDPLVVKILQLRRELKGLEAIGNEVGLGKSAVLSIVRKFLPPEEEAHVKEDLARLAREKLAAQARANNARRVATLRAESAKKKASEVTPKVAPKLTTAQESALIDAWLKTHQPSREIDFGLHNDIVKAARSLHNVLLVSNTRKNNAHWLFNGSSVSTEELYRRVNRQLIQGGLRPIQMPKE